MPPKQRARDAARRRAGLVLERLETRDVPTAIAHPLGQAATRAALAGIHAAQVGGGGTGATTALPSNQNPGVMNPTPPEVAKSTYVAGLTGWFQTSRGRYANEPLQAEVVASGGSNQSFHLNAQMQFFTYTIPGAVPTGQIVLSGRDVSTTGTQLVLDLTSDGTSFSHGLPTHYTWTVNPSSGGTYQNAVGSGTLDIAFQYDRGAPVGVAGRGRAEIKVTGSIVTGHGITLNIATAGNRTSR